MNTNEFVAAAAAIAGPLAAPIFGAGQLSAEKIQEVARAAVQIARQIEKEARQAQHGPY